MIMLTRFSEWIFNPMRYTGIITRAGRVIIDEVTDSSEALDTAVLFVIGHALQ